MLMIMASVDVLIHLFSSIEELPDFPHVLEGERKLYRYVYVVACIHCEDGR
jgi:hypothetical protein